MFLFDYFELYLGIYCVYIQTNTTYYQPTTQTLFPSRLIFYNTNLSAVQPYFASPYLRFKNHLLAVFVFHGSFSCRETGAFIP